MSPKDHRHPAWEAQWRDVMAEHQSTPATEEDWSAMSALLDGGGTAPPDPQPKPTVGGGISWKVLNWFIPALVVTGLVTAYWSLPGVEALVPTEVIGLAEEDRTEKSGADWGGDAEDMVLSAAPAPGKDTEPLLAPEEASFSADEGRRAGGRDPASHVRAQDNPEPVVAEPRGKGERETPGPKNTSASSATEPNGRVQVEETAGVDSVDTPRIIRDNRTITRTESPEVKPRRPYRRIPRHMPMLPRKFDPDELWQRRIDRQIGALRPVPQRPIKAHNGLYPRVKIRY